MTASSLTVKDIMTKEVVSVRPETSVFEAHKIISSNYFNGLPVIDDENRLLGIITEYDLLVKSFTLESFFSELSGTELFERLQEGIEKLKNTTVEEVMNKDPITLSADATAKEMVRAFVEHHRVNPIPVVDKDSRVVGIVSRYDALVLFYVNPEE